MRQNFEKENSRDGEKELDVADSNYFNWNNLNQLARNCVLDCSAIDVLLWSEF